MIGYLRGEILEHSDGKLLLLAGPDGDSGIGYVVCVPQRAAELSLPPGKRVELFIHTHVREDALDLYGFSSRAEKELFLALLTVNGIGPKMALGILSKVEGDELIRAIVEGDQDSLTRVPGIGKKTAERVVMELGDRLRKKLENGELREACARGTHVSAQRGGDAAFCEAQQALVALGYREPEVSALLQSIVSHRHSGDAPDVSELVKSALRQLARGSASASGPATSPPLARTPAP